MKKLYVRLRYLLLPVLVTLGVFVQAQSLRLNGKVINEKNEPLPGVSVKIAGGGGTSTNVEGRFSLSFLTNKKYVLEISAVGYSPKQIEDAVAFAGNAGELTITLEVKAQTGDNVIVSAKTSSARKETVNAVIAFQKNTNTVASVISAETIRRSPDKNTGEVLKRMPGASIQEGKFIIIRGLADRYNQAMLNGILLTSTEPDRKTFSFDLVPASMIDHIIINKAFVPEHPGEWSGGLIQVVTKDIPAKDFLNIQLGTGFNSQTAGKDFYRDHAAKTDWLGFDDGRRALPATYTRKAEFDTLSSYAKTAIGKQLRNAWAPQKVNAPLNVSFQLSGGFTGKLFGKQTGGMIGILYTKSNRALKLLNRSNALSNNIFSTNYDFNDERFVQEISAGALGSFSMQLNRLNKVSIRSIININNTSAVTQRKGLDYNRDEEMKGTEIQYKQNTFFTVQVNGDHSISIPLKLKWYGAFNILDGYIPDQRRITYTRTKDSRDPFLLLISNTLSQQSGSRIYQSLSDYIYTAGGDLSYQFNWLKQKQTVKAGYMLQVKDRLYDAQLFANYLPVDNPTLRLLDANQVFAPGNFGNGTNDKFAFDAIKGRNFRYMANTILNGAFLQFDNQFTSKIRLVWGLRVENYDQVVGSIKKWDPRHTHSQVTDLLPGLNATYKLNQKTNLRFSLSQTVIRPELRELSFLNLYDFEMNASVQGNPQLKRTKIANVDLRYEIYPRAGEVITAALFYKHFNSPIEQLFNEGAGGSSTFSYQNAGKATAYGAELEMRKKLDFIHALRHFTFQSNISYINSKVKDRQFGIDRSLQGQSPYVLNLGILYDLEKAGISATLLYNRIGERIYLVGDLSSGAGSPDIYEAPRSLFDFQLAKKLLKQRAELKFNIGDILNSTQYFYQNKVDNKISFQKSDDAYRFTRNVGTTYSIMFNYSIKQ